MSENERLVIITFFLQAGAIVLPFLPDAPSSLTKHSHHTATTDPFIKSLDTSLSFIT